MRLILGTSLASHSRFKTKEISHECEAKDVPNLGAIYAKGLCAKREKTLVTKSLSFYLIGSTGDLCCIFYTNRKAQYSRTKPMANYSRHSMENRSNQLIRGILIDFS